LQSKEPADSEDTFRRAYFTNYERADILVYYQSIFSQKSPFKLPFITFRLNYPPEEAQTIIRDQTRSTFLEEIVHPMRESLYVNGFKPSLEKDAVIIDGINWVEKITVKYVQSSFWARILVGIFAIVLIPFIYLGYEESILDLIAKLKIWMYRS
jgi:hypothetical protein